MLNHQSTLFRPGQKRGKRAEKNHVRTGKKEGKNGIRSIVKCRDSINGEKLRWFQFFSASNTLKCTTPTIDTFEVTGNIFILINLMVNK